MLLANPLEDIYPTPSTMNGSDQILGKNWYSPISNWVGALTKLTMVIQIRSQTANHINKYPPEKVSSLRSIFLSWIPHSFYLFCLHFLACFYLVSSHDRALSVQTGSYIYLGNKQVT